MSKVVEDLLSYGYVQRGILGINIVTMNSQLARDKDIEFTQGVYVAGINDGSGAEEAGLKVGDVTYDELPKELLIIVVQDSDKEFAVSTIIEAARTGDKGAFGDGKIFVSPVEEAYTISRGTMEL